MSPDAEAILRAIAQWKQSAENGFALSSDVLDLIQHLKEAGFPLPDQRKFR